MKLISKEVSRAEPEYMNIHPPPPISVLATALNIFAKYIFAKMKTIQINPVLTMHKI